MSIISFQSHSETRLELAPRGCLTVIVGPTDSGKTSIVRALKWLMYNQPSGTGFIRAGARRSSVSVHLSSGASVTRVRSASKNEYRLSKPRAGHSRQEYVLEGFGTVVPLEVQEMLGVRPVVVGELALYVNLAEQLDGPFLGKAVPSTLRAKALGRLAGSEVIDRAAKSLSTDMHRSSREKDRLEMELKSVESDIGRYSWVSHAADCIKSAEQVLARIDEKARAVATCQALREELAGLPDHETLLDRMQKARALLSQVQELDSHLSETIERYEQLSALDREMKTVIEDMESTVATLESMSRRLGDLKESYRSLAAQIEYCPTCGQRLPEGGLPGEQSYD